MGELQNPGVKKAKCKEYMLYNSIYMNFYSRNHSTTVMEIRTLVFLSEDSVTQRGTREVTGVMEMFYVLSKVFFTYTCTYVTNPINRTIAFYFM